MLNYARTLPFEPSGISLRSFLLQIIRIIHMKFSLAKSILRENELCLLPPLNSSRLPPQSYLYSLYIIVYAGSVTAKSIILCPLNSVF